MSGIAAIAGGAFFSLAVTSAGSTTDLSFTYAYDRLSRLSTVTGPDGNRSYGYDPVGNRTSRVLGSTTTYTYDRADRITAAGATAISVTATGVTTARGADTFTYDQANRLTSATVAGVTETSAYDGDGVRVSRQVGAGPAIHSVSDVNTALPVTVSDGTRTYVWGQGLAYAVAGTTVEVYHTDRLGSVRAITDAAGAVTATYRTDEFGLPTATTGTSTQPFAFTGEPRDASGLLYLRARSYDPSLGRFLSRDTWPGSVGAPQTLDRYAYVGNNPTTYVDPSGHCPWCLGAAVGGFIGGVAGLGGYLVGSIATGQAPDLGQAALATAGGAITGGVCGVTLGAACLAARAATSVVQYQASPGATNPVDDPLPYAVNAAAGAFLGRVTGGQVLRPNVVTFAAHVVPNVFDRFALNYPGWARALAASFFKSWMASSGSAAIGGLLNPPSAAAASRTLKPDAGAHSWR